MKYTNKYNLPETFVTLIDDLSYDPSKRDPKRMSITTLLAPPKITQLKNRHWQDMVEDVSDHIWRILGNAVHWVTERLSDKDSLIEEKIEYKIGDVTIVGVLDLYNAISCIVTDYKVTSVWKVMHGDDAEWTAQLNCYAWLMRRCGFEVKGVQVNAILKDWSRAQQMRTTGYPPIPFKVVNIPMWTDKETEKYIKSRIKLHLEAFELDDDDIPICSKEERWATDDKFAVKKGKNVRALRVLDTEKEALELVKSSEKKDPKNKYTVEKRLGQNKRCEMYCLPCNFCNFYKENVKVEEEEYEVPDEG